MAVPGENNAIALLQGILTAGATTFTLQSKGSLFPSAFPYKLKIEQQDGNGVVQFREIVTVTNRVSNNFTITRATENVPADDSATTQTSTAFEFSDGSIVSLTKTAQQFKDIDDEIDLKLDESVYDSEKVQQGTSSTGTDAYQANISTVSSYVDGQRYQIKVDVSNTENATFEANSLGAKVIKIGEGGSFIDIPTDTITAGGFANFTYISGLDIFQYTADPGNVIASSVEVTSSTFTAGEDINAGQSVFIDPSDGFAYLTDGSDVAKIKFAGFATQTITTGNPIIIDTTGINSNQTGLTPGADYYIENHIEGFELAGTAYDSKFVSLGSEDVLPQGLFIRADGIKLYIVGDINNSIFQYTMSTPWDISTATYDSKSITVTSETSPSSVWFKEDGIKMFVLGNSANSVKQYTLSTPWDVSTATYDSVNFPTTPFNNCTGFYIKSDGLTFWVTDGTSRDIGQFTMSNAWDMSTASYDTITFNVLSQDSLPTGVSFSSDGTKMFMVGSSTDDVFQYNLGTPFDITTAVYNSVFLNSSAQDTSMLGMFIRPDDGTKLYTVGSSNIRGYQYSMGTSIVGNPGEIITNPAINVVRVGNAKTATKIQMNTDRNDSLNGDESLTLTTGSVVLGNAVGMVDVKLNGIIRKVPFYDI